MKDIKIIDIIYDRRNSYTDLYELACEQQDEMLEARYMGALEAIDKIIEEIMVNIKG